MMKTSKGRGVRNSNATTPGAVSVVPQQSTHASSTVSRHEEEDVGFTNVAKFRASREAAKAKRHGGDIKAATHEKRFAGVASIKPQQGTKVATFRAQREAAKARECGRAGRDNNSTDPRKNSVVDNLRASREAAKARGQPEKNNTGNKTVSASGFMARVSTNVDEYVDEYTQHDLTETENNEGPIEIPTVASTEKYGLRRSSAQKPGAYFESRTSNRQTQKRSLFRGLRRPDNNNNRQESPIVCDRDGYDTEKAVRNKGRTRTSDGVMGTAVWCAASRRAQTSANEFLGTPTPHLSAGVDSFNNEELANTDGPDSFDNEEQANTDGLGSFNKHEVQATLSLEEKKKAFTRKLQCFIGFLILTIVVIAVSVKVSQGNEYSAVESSPKESIVDFVTNFLPNYTKESLLDPESPQSAALHWLQNDPLFASYSNSWKVLRFGLATFYFSTAGGTRSSWDNTNLVVDDGCPFQDSTQNSDAFCRHMELVLASGDLHGGTIPPELGLLTSLERIIFKENNLMGSIPSQIGFLTDLRDFDVGQNFLTGTIPSEFGLLTNIQLINMDHNFLKGTIPAALFEHHGNHSISKLEEVSLQENILTGTLPTQVGYLTSLKKFDVSYNNIAGTIPSHFGLMTKVSELSVQDNSLVGSLPTELGYLRKIEKFETQGNHLTGSIPSEFGLWRRGREITLDRNSLKGTFPSEVGLLSSMLVLNVSLNHLTGTIPSEVGLLSGARRLDFSSNRFTGSIPSEIGDLNVFQLRLQNNSFTGSLPTELGAMHECERIYIGRNNLTGVIPTEIGLLTLLKVFLAHSNSLAGRLPTELGNLIDVELLEFHNNNFTGPIPSEIGRALDLEQITIFNNSISGTMPDEVCWLREHGWLQEMVIDCNSVDCDCGCICHKSAGNQ